MKPPAQERSRLTWTRVLDAGARIIETQGVDNLTIAEVCRQADVSVAAIYARVSGKDALLLAIYDEVRSRIDRAHAELRDDAWPALTPSEAVDRAVTAVADLFLDHATFMRSVILLSGSHEQIRRRGSAWTTQLGRDFVSVLVPHVRHTAGADSESQVDFCYRIIVSTLVTHVGYGDRFASERHLSDEGLGERLRDVVHRLLDIPPATIKGGA